VFSDCLLFQAGSSAWEGQVSAGKTQVGLKFLFLRQPWKIASGRSAETT
jgi:hypothetical protein